MPAGAGASRNRSTVGARDRRDNRQPKATPPGLALTRIAQPNKPVKDASHIGIRQAIAIIVHGQLGMTIHRPKPHRDSRMCMAHGVGQQVGGHTPQGGAVTLDFYRLKSEFERRGLAGALLGLPAVSHHTVQGDRLEVMRGLHRI